MPRTSERRKDDSFNLRIDPALKAAFVAAAEAEDRAAASVLREFMSAYVKRREQRDFRAEAQRQSRMIAAHARQAGSDERSVMREIEADLDRDDFADEWKA
jgi:hypothetical protein